MIFAGPVVDTTLRKIDCSFAFLPPPLKSCAHRLDLPAISHHDPKKRKKKINPDRGKSHCGVSPLQTGTMAMFTGLGKSLPNLSARTLLAQRTSHTATTVQSTTCGHQRVTGENSESASHWNLSDL